VRDASACLIDGNAGIAIRTFYEEQGFSDFDNYWLPHVVCWARLCLPNGQIARSAWKEKLKPPQDVCMARNIKVSITLLSWQLYPC
jgi:hypothetical protein